MIDEQKATISKLQRRGRDLGVVDQVLDESFSWALMSGFRAAYNHYPPPLDRRLPQ